MSGHDQKQTAKRKAWFGFNSAVALLAAAGVVAGLNWLTATQLERLPASVMGWVRHDWTQTRQYSLSEQTQQTLARLGDGYEVVTLLPDSGEAGDDGRRRALADLLNEYRRYAPQLVVRDIRQGRDVAAEDALYAQLRERYAGELGPVLGAVGTGRDALADATATLQDVAAAVREAEDSLGGLGGAEVPRSAAADITAMRVELTSVVDQLIRYEADVDRAVGEPLPDYAAVLEGPAGLATQLGNLRRTLAQVLQRVTRVNRSARIDGVLRAERLTTGLQERMERALGSLQLSRATRGYDEAAQTLASGGAVVVLSADDARVVPADRVFVSAGDGGDPRFGGEELVTGALIALQLDPPPVVVFVEAGTGAGAGRKSYGQVSRRLTAQGMVVETWAVLQRLPEAGNPYKPDPAGEPGERAAGQRVVYVFQPFRLVDEQGTAAMNWERDQRRYLDVMRSRLEAGDGVFVLAEPEAKPASGESRVAALLRGYGVLPVTHRPILQERVVGELTQATPNIEVTRWPGGHPITRGLEGLKGVFVLPAPVMLLPDTPGVERTALAALEGERLWALEDFRQVSAMGEARFDPALASEVYTPVVAAERVGGDEPFRLVVASATYWAADEVTVRGRLEYPANTELFVNCVLWLAGLDDQIAQSARAQDVRRVEAVSAGGVRAVRVLVLVVVPALIALAGVVVFVLRRRG